MNDHAADASSPLAIVGMSCLFPQAPDLDSFWANIRRGRDCIVEIPPTHWSPDDYFHDDQTAPDRTYARRGGFLDPVAFDPLSFGISPNNLEAIDTAQLLGLVAAQRALVDAGCGEQQDRSRIGCILGVTGTLELVVPLGARLGHPLWKKALRDAGVPDDVAADVIERISDGYVPWQENSFPGLLGNVVAGRIANRLNLGGTNCVVDAACASSLSAMHLAALELATGRCDLVLTGGVDTFNDIFMYMCFSKTPALSPTGGARPFSESADGTILGEGIGVLALKRLADAERDGDRIHAIIRGIGTSSDGGGNAVYAPKADGQLRCLQDAYRTANVPPQSVELFEAHGTGTKVGDATEIQGLTQLLAGESTPQRHALGSVKSQIGHTKAAAGVAGVVKAVLALKHQVLPPTVKVDRPATGIGSDSPLYVNTLARPWLARPNQPRRAGVSAFGFGGSNFHCVLEESPQQTAQQSWDGSVQWLPWSADTPDQLRQTLESSNIPNDFRHLRAMAAGLRDAYNPNAPCRLHLVIDRFGPSANDVIADALSMLKSQPNSDQWQTPTGAYFGRGAAAGQLAYLFPGQGSQRPQMLRDLACVFPTFREALSAANAALTDSDERLSDLIYPIPAFTDEDRSAQQAALRATNVAQPALAAVSAGALSILDQFGIRADAFAGHSFGELTALFAAERFSAQELFELARRRGELMASASEQPGAMLALATSPEIAAEFLASERLDLVIANRNSPNQVVISGPLSEIDRAEERLAARSLSGKRLPVAAAFHSSLVAPAAGQFRTALDSVPFHAPAGTVYANSTATPYPADPQAARDLLGQQLAQPVQFAEEILRMYADGVRTFVEVGPGSVLTGLVRSILGERPHLSVALESSAGRRDGLVDLAHALAQLAAAGHAVNVKQWDPAAAASLFADEQAADRLRIPICGANYVKARPQRPPREPMAVSSAATPSTSPAAQPSATQRPAASAIAKPASSGSQTPWPTSAQAAPSPRAPETVKPPMPTASPSSSTMPAMPSTTPPPGSVERHLASLQQLQQQTAELHKQFLDNQQQALQTLAALAAGNGHAAPMVSAEPSSPLPSPEAVPAPPVASRSSSNGNGHAPAAPKSPQPRAFATPAPVETKPEPTPSTPRETSHVDVPNESADDNNVTPVLLEVVAEKTGYPAEMLKLSMSLDRDLGIDSIKRVEILSALQERLPHLPHVQPEQLGSLYSLEDVCQLLAGASTSAEPTASAPATTAPAPASDDLTPILLEVVAEKTGYPAEMLKLSMSLDRDLGIDSIKRVEILSALQERLPHLPHVQPEQLGSLYSLEDVCQLLGSVPAAAPEVPSAASPSASAPAVASSDLTPILLEVVAEKTGYPAEMLKLSMSLDRDLGIDSIKRVEILSALQERLPHLPHVQPEQLGALHSLEDVQQLLTQTAEVAPSVNNGAATLVEQPAIDSVSLPTSVVLGNAVPVLLDADELERRVLPDARTVRIVDDGTPLARGFVAALSRAGLTCDVHSWKSVASALKPSALGGLVLFAPADQTGDDHLQQACFLAQQSLPALRSAAAHGTPAFLTVSRLDGQFALQNGARAADPYSGGLAGLAKTARHEWAGIQCSASDMASDLWSSSAAGERLAELFLRQLPAEVGLSTEQTIEVRTIRRDEPSSGETLPISEADIVLVTGGARGVTAAAAIALARHVPAHFVIFGRSAPPAEEPEWLRDVSDPAEIKRRVLQHAKSTPTPRELDQRCRALIAAREMRETFAALRSAGATVTYRPVDVRDEQQTAAAVREIAAEFGPVRAVIHGAGVLADALIESKTPEQFAAVYETKVHGLRGVLAACDPAELVALVGFSSFTARYGRKGQVDYAIANEVLNKLLGEWSARHPHCRVASFNWGPWAGGMVTPELSRLFEAEGVPLIPLAAGAECVPNALASADRTPVEVVVLGAAATSDAFLEDPQSIRIAPPPRPPAPTAQTPPPRQAVRESSVAKETTAPTLRTVLSRRVSAARMPILDAHILDGKGVVPLALMIEWIGQAALHRHPDLQLVALDDVRVFQGLRVTADEEQSIQFACGKVQRSNGEFHVPIRIVSGPEDRPIMHAGATARLATHLPIAVAAPLSQSAEGTAAGLPGDLYENWLFHGAELQCIENVSVCHQSRLVATLGTAPAPAEWISDPWRGRWLMDPLVLDGVFQAMIVWCRHQLGEPSLPTAIRSLKNFGHWPTAGHVTIEATITHQMPGRVRADIRCLKPDGTPLAQLSGYECVVDAALERSFRQRRWADADSLV